MATTPARYEALGEVVAHAVSAGLWTTERAVKLDVACCTVMMLSRLTIGYVVLVEEFGDLHRLSQG